MYQQALYLPNVKFVALPVPEIIAIAVLAWGFEPQYWGRGGRRGSEMIPFERALVSSYQSINQFIWRKAAQSLM